MQHVLLIACQSVHTISRNITHVSQALLFNLTQSQNFISGLGSMVFISDRFELKDFRIPGSSYVFAHENNRVQFYLHTMSLIWGLWGVGEREERKGAAARVGERKKATWEKGIGKRSRVWKGGCWDERQGEKVIWQKGERLQARVAGAGRGQEAKNSEIFNLRAAVAL